MLINICISENMKKKSKLGIEYSFEFLQYQGYITLREICHDKNKSAGLQKLSLKKW